MGAEHGTGARRAILDSTRELLDDPGSTGVGMERIAEHAGFSRQAIYRHFGSRAGLLKTVLADIDERAGADASVRQVMASGDGDEVLDALIAWWSGYVAGFVGVSRSVLAGRAADPALAAAWDDRMAALMGVCKLVVERCAEDKLLRAGLKRRAATEILWGMLSIPLWDQLINDLGWSPRAYRERVGLQARATLFAA